MNEDELEERKVKIIAAEKVILKDYKIALTHDSVTRKGGTLDMLPSEKDIVEGVLYNLPDTDITKINEKEGVCAGTYEPIIINVETIDGRTVDSVIAYQVCKKINPPIASQEYKDSVLRGACEHGLSKEYRDKLKAILEKRKI